ncbi:MAG: hypothetical protein R3A10_18510 [Caldilineaceae bacterium]
MKRTIVAATLAARHPHRNRATPDRHHHRSAGLVGSAGNRCGWRAALEEHGLAAGGAQLKSKAIGPGFSGERKPCACWSNIRTWAAVFASNDRGAGRIARRHVGRPCARIWRRSATTTCRRRPTSCRR